MRVPYLIQRASIIRPINLDKRLSMAVNFEYMGSAEFEWGALPKSFRDIEAHADNFIMRFVPGIVDDNGNALQVWSYFNDTEFAEYEVYLNMLRNPSSVTSEKRLSTKEFTGFEAKQFRGKQTNFWWDIENQVMFGFDPEFMPNVGCFVANSLIYMNAKKAN
jgi:hypothetical protein